LTFKHPCLVENFRFGDERDGERVESFTS